MDDGAGSRVRQQVREAGLKESPGEGRGAGASGSAGAGRPGCRASGACGWNSPAAPTKVRISSGCMVAEV